MPPKGPQGSPGVLKKLKMDQNSEKCLYTLYKPSGALTYQPFPSRVVGDLQMDNKVGPLGVPKGLPCTNPVVH